MESKINSADLNCATLSTMNSVGPSPRISFPTKCTLNCIKVSMDTKAMLGKPCSTSSGKDTTPHTVVRLPRELPGQVEADKQEELKVRMC